MVLFKVLPNVKTLNGRTAIAGLGLEYRVGNRCSETGIETATQLAKCYGCGATELISCDGVSRHHSLFENRNFAIN